MAARQAAAPVGVNFGSMSFYVAGGGLPEGDYILTHEVRMYQAEDAQGVKKGPERLGVMITAQPLNDLSPDSARTQFYSMGSKANLSFAPNAAGKGILPVPGGPATTLNNQTNWAFLLKSYYDSGLPEGIFTNDFSVLDGVHVHMTNVPEPAERAGFQSTTGEAEMAARKPGTIAIITEIKDDGKPWEGTGGTPKAGKAAAKPALVKPAAKPVAAPEPEDDVDEAVKSAALDGITTVIEKNPNGMPKLKLRTDTFKAVKAAHDDDMANAVTTSVFASDDALNVILADLGYVCEGSQIKVL